MLATERRLKIVEFIQQDRKVHVSNLSKLFDVTEETMSIMSCKGLSLDKRYYGIKRARK
ncbi:DeoR family transcriptional regulator [Pelosinus sp. IPA-1]|uniref:DeoR family transcriptional regulator n=1 Tax=Pelosinus sp. IPA-1 TaxID=3029569 RepID=UPI0024362733|nr:DeoR family transcriptional regulator [Pelosinus sp. IPA-1]GMA97349.1 hypothetical protein PIPA1_01490 [Pelosinus sp. IPA-1]